MPDELRIDLTAESPEWDPSSTCFQDQENKMLASDGRPKDPVETCSSKHVIVTFNSIWQPEIPDFHLVQAMCSTVGIDDDKVAQISLIASGTRKSKKMPGSLPRAGASVRRQHKGPLKPQHKGAQDHSPQYFVLMIQDK